MQLVSTHSLGGAIESFLSQNCFSQVQYIFEVMSEILQHTKKGFLKVENFHCLFRIDFVL